MVKSSVSLPLRNKNWTKHNFDIESLISRSDQKDTETQRYANEYSIWNDLKQTKILMNFIITVWIFCFETYIYFLMGFYMKYAVGDIFVNTLLTSSWEIFAYLSAAVVIRIVGLRLSLMVFSCMSIIFAIPLMLDIPIWVAYLCLILARFGVQAAFPCLHYLSNSDLFNPLFVPFLYSVGNFSAKIFTIFAPQIVELPEPIPMISFIIGSFGILVCSLLIKM